MAKLLSYFNLCPIMDPKDILGVAEGKEEGTIINTLGKNIIIIMKVSRYPTPSCLVLKKHLYF